MHAPPTCATMYTDWLLLIVLEAYEAAAPTRTPSTLALTSAEVDSWDDSSESDENFWRGSRSGDHSMEEPKGSRGEGTPHKGPRRSY